MKKIIFVLIALCLVVMTAQAQTIRVTKQVMFGSGRGYCLLGNSLGDSTAQAIQITAQAGDPYPLIAGQYPDSIRISFYSTADSVKRVKIHYKCSLKGSGAYTNVLLDSLYDVTQGTAAINQGSHTIPVSGYLGYDLLNISVLAQATFNAAGNQTTKATAAKGYVFISKYYHMLSRP
jgi:hypothetical protein